MNFSALKTTLHGWAVSINAIETIFANQNGNVPDDPFCTLLVQPVGFIGQDDYSVDASGDVTYLGQREISVSVQYFGTDAMQKAIDLTESLEENAARELLALGGIIFVDRVSGINDLSEVLDTGFEERAGIDLMFRTCSERVKSGDLIDSTEITGDYEDADGSQIQRILNIDSSP